MKLTTLPTGFVLLVSIIASACSSNTATPRTTAAQPALAQTQSLQADAPSATVQRLRIKHYMVECEGYQVTHCFLAKEDGSNDWFYFYNQIKGFEYQWGSDYDVLVEVKRSNAQLADASELNYTLVEVITQKQHNSGEVFQYVSRNSHERITELADGQFSLLGKKAFTCTDNNCTNLRSAIAQNQSTVLTFQHSDDPAKPLVLAAVLCSDAKPSFIKSFL